LSTVPRLLSLFSGATDGHAGNKPKFGTTP
jgi:hypothetical protein